MAMNFVCRFENLQTDLDLVTEHIGIPSLVLPHAKANYRKDHQHYSQLINPAAREHIERLCREEIEFFNYQWSDVP